MGTSGAAPKAVPEDQAGFQALSGSTAGGGAAFTHQILPRHKAAVRKYFEKEEDP